MVTTGETVERVSQSTGASPSPNAPFRPYYGHLKIWCYLVCLLAVLLTVSPDHIGRPGLCVLLLFAPLGAVRWLRQPETGAAGRHLLWLVLALGWAVGVLTCGGGPASAGCLCVSLLFWAVYLCRRVYSQCRTPKDIFTAVFQALLYDPCAFFAPDPAVSRKTRRRHLAWWGYAAYIIMAALLLLLLLIIQAESRIDGILRAAAGFICDSAHLIVSCLVVAVFPASLIYSFLCGLKAVPAVYLSPNRASGRRWNYFGDQLCAMLCGLFIGVDCFFLAVEVYYCVVLHQPQPLQEDGLFDVLAVLLVIFIGLGLLYCRATRPRRHPSKLSVMLGVSTLGLTIFTGLRLHLYVMSYGLWAERAFFSVVLLFFALPLLGLLLLAYWGRRWFFRTTASVLAILLTLLIAIPEGVVLTQVNAAVFLNKYQAQELDGQSGEDIELSERDLRVDLMESYGIDGIPALTSLTGITDVTVDGQTLGLHVQNAILDCLCSDLGLTRTGDNQADLNMVCSAAYRSSRYRLPTTYAWVLRELERVKSHF